ncbi:MAG: PD-(D/E)XK nuclease family protein [Nonlabens sp.]
MNQTNCQNLFSKTREIVKAHHAEVRAKGEDFNIFSVLGMESNETKTHSGMLVALLDPKGNHYQGSVFLRLFLEEISYDYENEDLDKVMVKAEHHLGKISDDYLSGGYIDVLISFPSGKAIAIENKIYAGDQPFQMYRYSLYKKDHTSLYYLNLYGDKPSPLSLHTLKGKDYGIITYRHVSST